MGIRDKPIAPASPWQNGFAERLIGSIRREKEMLMPIAGKKPKEAAAKKPAARSQRKSA
jgi:hypothetical protein